MAAQQTQGKWKLHDKQTFSPRLQRASGRWEVFAQTQFSVSPKATYYLLLSAGVQLIQIICIVSFRQEFKILQCSLQHRFIAESVDNIIITTRHNLEDKMSIAAGASLSYIIHQSA